MRDRRVVLPLPRKPVIKTTGRRRPSVPVSDLVISDIIAGEYQAVLVRSSSVYPSSALILSDVLISHGAICFILAIDIRTSGPRTVRAATICLSAPKIGVANADAPVVTSLME